MKKVILTSLIVVMVVGIGTAFAGKGNGFPSGPHEELGLIGRPNVYNGNGTDNSPRGTIFIPLNTDGYVDGKVKLKMTQGDQFLVIDGDATEDGEAQLQIGPGYYAVFARALGIPGGNIKFWAYFTYWYDTGVSSDAIYLGGVDLTRDSKKPQTIEISKLFYYTGDVTTASGTTSYNNEWVFDIPEFNEYWWDIDNNGCKRLEIRFYKIPEDELPYVPPEIPEDVSLPEP